MIRRLLLLTLGTRSSSLERYNEEHEACFSQMSPEEYLEHQWRVQQYNEVTAKANKEPA